MKRRSDGGAEYSQLKRATNDSLIYKRGLLEANDDIRTTRVAKKWSACVVYRDAAPLAIHFRRTRSLPFDSFAALTEGSSVPIWVHGGEGTAVMRSWERDAMPSGERSFDSNLKSRDHHLEWANAKDHYFHNRDAVSCFIDGTLRSMRTCSSYSRGLLIYDVRC